MKTRSCLLAFSRPALLLAAVAFAVSAGWAQSGHLGYLKDDAAFVVAADGTGTAVRLPGSEHAVSLSLSPSDGTALFFVAPQKLGPDDLFFGGVTRGAVVRPPYAEATFLGVPFDHAESPSVSWAASGGVGGAAAFLQPAWDGPESKYGRYTPDDGKTVPYPIPVHSASSDGAVVAYNSGGREIRVRFRATGKEKVLFSWKVPAPLFAAVQRAKNPKNLSTLGEMDSAMYKDQTNWAIGVPAITPDGKTVFFGANAGTGMGASGNTTWALFAADVASGKLSTLSKVGQQNGLVPYDICRVSPDGRWLLVGWSFHNSAIDTPGALAVIDLPTQTMRVGFMNDAPRKSDTNLLDGACWSPDGKYFAYSVLYHPTDDSYKGTDPAKFTVIIRETATGKLVRKIAGARAPSWGR